MALKRPLQSIACSQCQGWVLRSFVAAVTGQTQIPLRQPPQKRLFSRTTIKRNEMQNEIQDEHPLKDINNGMSMPTLPKTTITEINAPESENPLPWYLQHQADTQEPTSPLKHLQKLPELLHKSSPILSPLMSHIFDALGMDSVHILDLRLLDPPPALGASLIMLLGTARSERHLHVSADRLCRWLRTEYKLTPHADGLLGRNELKLKLRRKAKRARLLSTVGAKETSNSDIEDGVRTGWVCVDVGKVEGGVLKEEKELEGFVGFNDQKSGCRIVVQLMTEEKREELELEKLWSDVLEKQSKNIEAEVGQVVAVGEILDPINESNNTVTSEMLRYDSSSRDIRAQAVL